MRQLLLDLEELLGESLTNCRAIKGGDICNAFQLITTSGGKYFVKHHKGKFATNMFQAEALSLTEILNAGFPTPQIILQEGHYLILQWIESGSEIKISWETFGRQLALLHSNVKDSYGFDLDGYIGPVYQNNAKTKLFYEFYITQRMEPLIKSCFDLGLLTQKDLSRFYTLSSKIEGLIPLECPVLIHGDLWSGNYMVDDNSTIYLIDAASSYCHRGFDLGMMKLFGGFPELLFNEYQNRLAISNELINSLDLFQLYYLLIHLNLFGKGYYQSVSSILMKYE